MYKRPIGRPKTRWEDDVLEDIKSINLSNWKKAKNRDSWKKVFEQARTLCSMERFIRRRRRRSNCFTSGTDYAGDNTEGFFEQTLSKRMSLIP